MTLFEQGHFASVPHLFPAIFDKHPLRSIYLLLYPLEAALHKYRRVRSQGLHESRALVRIIDRRHLEERTLERWEIHGMSSKVCDE